MITLREERDRLRAAAGFAPGRRFALRFGPLRLPLPDPGWLDLHDCHHALTGFSADVVGECLISAWELRTGCPSWYIRGLCVAGVALGLVAAPVRTVRAWRAGAGARNGYRGGLDGLLDLPLDEARRASGLPMAGLVG